MNTLQCYLLTPTRVTHEDGHAMTRAELIVEMRGQGIPQRAIDRYLQGLDYGERLRKEPKP